MRITQNVKLLERIQCGLMFFILIWILVMILHIEVHQAEISGIQRELKAETTNHIQIILNQELFKKILLDPNYKFPDKNAQK